MTSCVQLFLDAALRYPEHIALRELSSSITFKELRARGEACAKRLRAAGLKRGDRVVVLVPMSIELYSWIIGILQLDMTVMFVEPWMPLDLIAGCCAKAKPQAILASPLGVVLAQRAPAFRRIPLKLVTSHATLFSLLGWKAAPEGGAEAIASPAADDDDMAVLTFTTGSSGVPKGVVRTHGLLRTQHQVLSRSLHLTSSDVCLHAFANFVLNNLALGAVSVLPPMRPSAPTKFSPSKLAAQINATGVTSLVVPPASLERLVSWAESTSTTLPTIKSVATGGGPVPTSLLMRTARVMPSSDPEIIYGSSEVEPVSHLAWSELKDLKGDGVCVGKPVDEVRVKLADKGEIVVSGAHVSPRYFEDPEAMAKTKIVDEAGVLWHRMGDTATTDAQGRLWLTGRVHNQIETAKGTVLPMVVERRVEGVEGVVGAAVVGVAGRVVVVVEGEVAEEDVRAAAPEVDVVVFAPVPRDRRHRSKVDYIAVKKLAERA